MRFANRALCAGGLGFAVSCLAACGGSGNLLSAGQASQLNAQLDRVSQALANHQCQQAADQISAFQSAVDGMNSVDPTLISNLDQGGRTIAQLAQRQCPTTTHTTPTTATNTATTTTPTTTTITQTVPTPTTTTPTSTNTTPTTSQTTPAPPGQSGGVAPGDGAGGGHGKGHDGPKGNGDAQDTSP